MSIQVFVPTYDIDECLKEIRDCLEKNWTGLGYKTVEFENKWKEYTGLENAHFLNSATAGLHLAVKILKMENNWNDGDEIITTGITFISTPHSIMYENMKPVFADVDEYLCLDPMDIIKKVTSKTRAILYVGYGGNVGQYDKIVNICRDCGLKLILDMAHCAGTKYKGETPGKEADAIVYSFQAVKPLPSADSGMVCFKDKKNDELARKLSWLGINKDTYTRSTQVSQGNYKWKYDVEYVGYKYHGNSIMAAICLAQLKRIDQDNEYRRKIASWYDDCFQDYWDRVRPIPVIHKCDSSRHLYVIEVQNRDELIVKLNENGINPGVHYLVNTDYSVYSYAKGTCPNADRMNSRILTLPIHLKITKEDVNFISSKVLEYTV